MKPFWRRNKETVAQEPELPNPISFWISGLEFNDGTRLELKPDEVVVFVGPNNVGKTATLVEMSLRLKNRPCRILRGLSTVRTGSESEMTTWFAHVFTIEQESRTYRGWGGYLFPRDIGPEWKNEESLGDLTEFLCRFVSTEERLEASKPAESIDVLTEACQKPVQILSANKTIEQQLSDASIQAFGIPLFLDRWSGKKIGIRCGKVPTGEPWTLPFLKEVRNTPALESQGDGIRSFVGCILEGVLTPHLVVCIDEPEAFLHPQHARVLGRMLSSAKPPNRQLFIATHSVHLLLGLLDAVSSQIRVVRIRREGDCNPIRELGQDQIKEVWEDSLLRASNVLEGIFHEKVVICEGDADCRFYNCLLDAIVGPDSPIRRPDIMFTSCGGKNRMPMVIRALRALDVPVRTIVDFDVLQNGQDLRLIVEAYGHGWSDIESAWSRVNRALRDVAPPLSLAQVQSRISESLKATKGSYLDERTRKDLLDCLRIATPWAAAKRGGKSSLPSGDPTAAYADLTNKLRAIGVFIVDCGELERFAPSVGAHGPGWVTEVLRKDLATDSELQEAREFVCKVTDIQHGRTEHFCTENESQIER